MSKHRGGCVFITFHFISTALKCSAYIKALNGTAPKYLRDLLILYQPNRILRSIDKKLLAVPSYNLERYGRRAFSVAAPILWNRLPDKLRNTVCIDTFKKELKTFLFRRTYI